MVDTDRLDLTLVEGTDTIGGTGGFKDKVNAALSKLDTAVGYVLCTSTTRPGVGVRFPGMQIRESDTGRRYILSANDKWTRIGGDTFDSTGSGSVRSIRPARPLGMDTNHSAFPAVLYKQDGEIICVYRQGSDHITARDGYLRVTRSSDMGRTWTTPSTLLQIGGIDLRDPGLSESRDGTKVWLTYCKTTSAVPFGGAYFRVSTDGGVTFGAETRIDHGTTAACVAPIIETLNGNLLMPWYGTLAGETNRSSWVSRSTNGGTSWTHTRIVNGHVDGRMYDEPYLAMLPGTNKIACMFRWGAIQSIGFALSTDGGTIWSAAAEKFPGTGKPNCFWVNDNTLAVIFRKLNTTQAVVRYTRNDGVTWFAEKLIEPKRSSGGWMSYSDTTQVQRGVFFFALGQETLSTASRIYFGYVGEAGSATPFGNIPSEALAAAENSDNVLLATNFDQPDGLLTDPWTVYAGSLTVTNGEVASTTADATQDFARAYVGTGEVDVEAEFVALSTGTNTGYAIIFRHTDANTHLMFTNETLGTRLRLYKFFAGSPTMLAEVIADHLPDTYHKLRVVARNRIIRCYWDDNVVISHLLSTGDYATYGSGLTPGWVGFSVWSRTDNSVTKCRRFIARG